VAATTTTFKQRNLTTGKVICLFSEGWNYKRQAWALLDAERDYGTSFMKEVQKLNGKPYYALRRLPEVKKQK
jgi:hypothetical protein